MKLLVDGAPVNGGFYFLVHLDEAKLNADGTPQEDFLREFVFTNEQEVKMSKREVLSLCRAELEVVKPEAIRRATIASMRKC